MKLLVLDGNSIVNRAFYGIKLLTTKDGRFTNAIYGFLNILSKLENDEKPDEVAIAFDLRAPTFRHKMYDGYKAQRKGMPEELAAQMPVLQELLVLLGYNIVTCEGFEADDILGTLAAQCASRGDECVIATGDRDSLQLVGNGTRVLLASTQMGRSVTINMNEEAVIEKYGVSPKQLIDVKSLMGDASDNIPGAKGIGEKTAISLISQFGNIDNVYENIDDPTIKAGVRQKLTDFKSDVYMSLELAKINCEAPVEKAVGTYVKGDAKDEAGAFLQELEMPSMIEKLGLSSRGAKPANAQPLGEVDALDTNNINGKISLIFVGEKAYCVQKNSVACVNTDTLCKLLANENIEKQCFNSKAFYKVAFENNTSAKNIVFDGKLAAYLLNPAASDYTVLQLAAEYGINPVFDHEHEETAVVEALFEKLSAQCKEQKMDSLLLDIEQPLAEVLADMETVGILVDKPALIAFGETLQIKLKQELEEIYSAVGYEFNVNSPKQLGEALFVKLGLPTRKKNKSGFSTDAETLESLREYTPVINNIMQYRTYQKLNSTYVEGLLKVIGADGRIHSTFNQTETRTGRISSGEPNLQNIPVRTELGRELRKFFIAKEGQTLLDADYSQIELRILAHISQDEAMQEIFCTGGDIHRSTAAKIHHLDPSEVTSDLRSSAKAVNFGIVYGIGAFSLSKDINVSVKEADNFIKNYLGAFPNVKKYMDDTIAFGHENGYVTTMFGRRRSLPELNSSNFNLRALGERMAMNTPIQGTAADIIKLAMIRVYKAIKAEGLSAKLILQVHDELIVEAPFEEQAKATEILQREMQKAAQLTVPLEADVHSGETWFIAHS